MTIAQIEKKAKQDLRHGRSRTFGNVKNAVAWLDK
jgi:hypothetical protein